MINNISCSYNAIYIFTRSITFLILVLIGFANLVNAQLPAKKFKETYKERAQKETNTMITRYKLNAAQATKIEKLNTAVYAEINTVLQTNKDRQGRKKAVDQVREKREQQLKLIFSKQQYTAYRKDMDAVELKAQQRIDELNKNMPRERLRPIK